MRTEPQPAKPRLSVVAPVFCEEEGIALFYARLKAVLVGMEPGVAHEIVFVDDGSTDRSPEVLEELASKDPAVRVVHLSRNFGHQAAITAGLDHATGDAVVTIDSDLQDPPEVIPRLFEQWLDGFEVVHAIRLRRQGDGALKKLLAKVHYRVIRSLSEVDLPVDAGDLRLMDRCVVDALNANREASRYIRGLVVWLGFRQTGITYERDARFAGESKYPFARQLRLSLDGIASFSEKPLYLASYLGLAVVVPSLLGIVWVLAGRLLFASSTIPGWASLALVVLFLGGVQLFTIGILGQYVGRTYRQAKGRPLYVARTGAWKPPRSRRAEQPPEYESRSA